MLAFDAPPQRHVVATTADEVIDDDATLRLGSLRGGTAQATTSEGKLHDVDFGALPQPIEPDRWALHVEGSVPSGSDSHDLELDTLADWREIPELQHSSGFATYRTQIELDGDWVGDGRGAYLQLGTVHGAVQVSVNGQLVSPACVAPAAWTSVGCCGRAPTRSRSS